MTIFIFGSLAGVALTMIVTYLSTHAEVRGALFSKLHSTADEIKAEIAAKVKK